MQSSAYIESGILEAYSLGCLTAAEQAEVLQMCIRFPELKAELYAIERSLQSIAELEAVQPRAGMRKLVIDALSTKPVDIANLPETSSKSVLTAWLDGVAHLIPAQHDEPLFQHLLRQDADIMQALVVSQIDIPEEAHNDVVESFFILKGQCRCMVAEREYILEAGDFLEIPLHKNHNVQLLSPYVVAIHQQKALPGQVLA